MKNPIQFSEKEFNYIQDQDFLLSKHVIIKKIMTKLAHIEKIITTEIQHTKTEIPKEVLQRAGKISKGENYRGLPYLVLDHPRYFKKEGVFAFRTMFWWGHFFSSTLHLQGKHLEKYRYNLRDNIMELKNNNLYICNSATPWEYHYNNDNYVLIDSLDKNILDEILLNKEFIKISGKLDLQNWNELENYTIQTFQLIIQCLNR